MSVCFSARYLKNRCSSDHQTSHINVPRWVVETRLFWGQRSRLRVTKTLSAWVFALLWVLASSSCNVTLGWRHAVVTVLVVIVMFGQQRQLWVIVRSVLPSAPSVAATTASAAAVRTCVAASRPPPTLGPTSTESTTVDTTCTLSAALAAWQGPTATLVAVATTTRGREDADPAVTRPTASRLLQ